MAPTTAQAEADEDLVNTINKQSTSTFISKFIAPSAAIPLSCVAKSGDVFTIAICRSDDLSLADFTTCFDLVETTSGAMYAAASSGWIPEDKKSEMAEPFLWYLLLRPGKNADMSTAALGFASFMITIEDGHPVIYLYEIHLDASLRGSGLGSELMTRIEETGRRACVTKAMLTFFTANEGAERFYRHRGYVTDSFSPRERILRSGKIIRPDYVILSKPLEALNEREAIMDGSLFASG